ncbi:MAG TPA: aminoacyl-tRNA hydrolase [Candidatus Paceibacterota bacterium]|nr:aminoacyl-tRNA hydrolase [Candidatus Paceibacterota bacterium]
MYIFIGLGNPGKEYERTRHNTGKMAVEALAGGWGVSFEQNKVFNAQVVKHDGALLAIPNTYMNDSGSVVKVLKREYADAELVVLYDDIDIPLGTVKCSFNRGAGGHNGVQSIIDSLGTNEFFRIRIGVRPIDERLLPQIAPPTGFQDFLLSNFTPLEDEGLKEGITKAAAIAKFLLTHSREETMNIYN